MTAALPTKRFGTSAMQADLNALIDYVAALGPPGGAADRIENASGEGAYVDTDGTVTVILGDFLGAEEFVVRAKDTNPKFRVNSLGDAWLAANLTTDGAAILKAMAAPSAVAGHVVIYGDTADAHLYGKMPGGTAYRLTHNLTSDIDHDALAGFIAAEHIDWSVTGAEDVHPDRIGASAVTQHGAAINHNALLNTHNLTSDIDHDALAGFVAAEHVALPSTIANVLSDHHLAAHAALGLFSQSSQVDHDATGNFVAAEHIDWTNAASNLKTSGSVSASDGLWVSLTAGIDSEGNGELLNLLIRRNLIAEQEVRVKPMAAPPTPVGLVTLYVESSDGHLYAKAPTGAAYRLSHNLNTDIQHDALAGYVAARHIDWTVTGAEDVHPDRIGAGSVTQHVGALNHNALLNTHNLTSDIQHDALAGYVADEHVAHSAVSISAGAGLAGGGSLAASRTLSLSHLGIQNLANPGADRLAFWDASAGAMQWLAVGSGLSLTDTTLTAAGGAADKIENASSDGVYVDEYGTVRVVLGDSLGAEQFVVRAKDTNPKFHVNSLGDAWLAANLTLDGAAILKAMAAPGVVAGHIVVYDNSADGHLYAKLPAGTSYRLTHNLTTDIDHDQLSGFVAAEHVSLPSTIANVLSDHTLAAHTALGLFDASSDVDHDQTTNFLANEHIDWTNATANFKTSGALSVRRNSTDYTGAIFVPLTTPLTSTDFDGDTRVDTQNATIDLSAKFGVPANVKAVCCTLSVRCATAGKQVCLGPSSTYYYAIHQHAQVANQYVEISGTVPCDANGDVYFYTDAVSGAGMTVYWRIWGYFI